MSDQSTQPEENRAGSSDHPQHRTPGGEGADAGFAQHSGEGPAEISLYDGKGNEQVGALTEDESGFPRQGSGQDLDEAAKDAKDPSQPIGEGFNPDPT